MQMSHSKAGFPYVCAEPYGVGTTAIGMNSRGGACSPADSDVDDIHFGTERFYLFDFRALDDFYFYYSFSYSSYL